MAVKNFGGTRGEAENYGLRKVNDQMLFLTMCAAGDEGAIQMTRTKDGAHHKVGDTYFMRGGNAVSGRLSYIAVKDGYPAGGVSKELSIGFAPEKEGGKMEFVTLPLVNDKHKINDATRRLLPALLKAELGEEITIAASIFNHKAGEEMKDREGNVIGTRESDGYATYLTAYQDHLITPENKNGKIVVDHDEMFVQERLIQKGRELVALAADERAPKDSVITYDEGVAERYARDVVDQVKARLPKNEKMEQAANKVASSEQPPISDDDIQFGDEPAPATSHQRGPRT
jgi:hypothetical protein